MDRCKIFIKGKGHSRSGALKEDWHGTVREAIKDWDVFYRAVLKHVKDCDKCDPTEVLQAYWDLRQGPKHNGQTSIGLASLAIRYKRIGADPELVKKFVANTGYPDTVIKYAHLFNDEELYGALCQQLRFALNKHGNKDWQYDSVVREISAYLGKKKRPFLYGVMQVFSSRAIPPYEEVAQLAVIAEITVS